MDDRVKQSIALMEQFAVETGLSGDGKPIRYLWTDAFAVCNFLGLAEKTGDSQFDELARKLIDQVHETLGRHRDDDSRTGWLSGLADDQAREHPTAGGLRIGKPLPERPAGEPLDQRAEWDRDGQYFHYLTKWMHALYRAWQHFDDSRYFRWAVELALVAHRHFTYEVGPAQPKRMYWKMSVDLSRPLVPSMGQHDPVDGLVCYLELRSDPRAGSSAPDELDSDIDDMLQIVRHMHGATDDPLGIGGLLDSAVRLAILDVERNLETGPLIHGLVRDASIGLGTFLEQPTLRLPAEHRLAFREMGLAIGIRGSGLLVDRYANSAREWIEAFRSVVGASELADHLEEFWLLPENQRASTWREHKQINAVMLATSLVATGYFGL